LYPPVFPLPAIEREPNRLITTTSADTPLKGLNYLLQAVADIANIRPIRLIVVGSPKKNSSISRLITRLGIGHLIRFTGPIDTQEYVRQYAKASMAVVPSVYEGFGLPAGEAMACGLPVISTNGGALPEVVGDAGILVPPGDSRALARQIITLCENPALAFRIGQAGFKRVRKHFTWEKAALKTVAVYRKAIHAYRKF
jgi:glycosyltransferase involved in cell wall biosynthesis